MAIKKGDLVKVVRLEINDTEVYGIIKGETYKVVKFINNLVYINAGKGNRDMYNHQIEKVKKKKSKKDLRIQELENTIKQMKDILNK